MGRGEGAWRMGTSVVERCDPVEAVRAGDPKGRVGGWVQQDEAEHAWSVADLGWRVGGTFPAEAVLTWGWVEEVF